MREDKETAPSLWLVYDTKPPERHELWCGTLHAPDNLHKQFGSAAVYPLGRNALSELSAGRSMMGMRGPLIFCGPRPSGQLVVGVSYDPDDQLIYDLQNLPPTVRPPSSAGSASTSTVTIKTENPEVGVKVKREAPAAAPAP